jgi:hypothetical protein
MGIFDWLKRRSQKDLHADVPLGPANIDWPAFEVALTAALEAEVVQFAAAHTGDTFYGLALDCNAYYADILLCANTNKSLDEAVVSDTQADHSPDAIAHLRGELRWSFGDWQYQGFNLDSAPWQRAMDARLAALAGLPTAEDVEQFLVSCCRALIAVERGAAILKLNRTPDFQVACIDHDENFEQGQARLDAVRRGL